VGTFSKIAQHAPIQQLDEAADLMLREKSVDTIISVGGGSPIDSAKIISKRVHDKKGEWMWHIAIPTTISAAECTALAGYSE
jgi:alcohol dehydrogenase class IV